MEMWISGARTSVLPLALAVLVVIVVVLWRRKRSPFYLLCVAVFGSYLLLVIHITLFPIRIDRDFSAPLTLEPFKRSINLIPFNFDLTFIPDVVLLQIVQNVLLTIPFGFGINFIARVSGRRILWLAVGVGLGIETLQLVIALLLVGYAYRIIDINDVILNALGVLLGYGSFRLGVRLYPPLGARLPLNQAAGE